MKKFFVISSIIVFAALLISGALFFFNKARFVQETRRVVEQEKLQEEKMKDPLQAITSRSALGFWFFGDTLLGISDAGRLFSAAETFDAPEDASQPTFDALRGISPSQDGSRVLILNGNEDGSSEIYIYNAPDELWQRISGRALAAALSPDGKKIARVRETFGVGATVEIAPLDGGVGHSIGSAAPLDASLLWTASNQIELKTVPSRTSFGYSFLINTDTRKIVPLALEKNGLMTLWSPSSRFGFAYWIDENGRQRSAFIDSGGAILQYTNTPLLPVKCAFADDTRLICGAFRKDAFIDPSGLPDEYLMGAIAVEDQIVSVDVQTGRITTLLESPKVALDVFGPQVRDGKFYFINRYGGIYSFAF